MLAIYYISKRTLFDILRTGLFWVAVALCGFLVFSLLYWGWGQVEREVDRFDSGERPVSRGFGPDSETEWEDGGNEWDPLSNIKPETMILWHVYGITIGFANLLAIFVMMGLLGRELDRRTIDLLIARPVSRAQIYLGKLFAGWISTVIFMAALTAWTLICMQWGGMGVQPGYVNAAALGTIAPILVGSITLLLTIWMRGFLAGLLAVIITFAGGTTGMFMIKILGVEVLKLKTAVMVVYKILPPMNVIGIKAVDYLETDLWFRFVQGMFSELGPTAADGLYTEMWQVWTYLAGVLILGWLSFFRRQFT